MKNFQVQITTTQKVYFSISVLKKDVTESLYTSSCNSDVRASLGTPQFMCYLHQYKAYTLPLKE